MYSLYIVKCSDGTLYTGITTDLERRIKEHNSTELGAKYTRGRRPVKLVYCKKFKNRSLASKAESSIKKLSKKEKMKIIKNNSHKKYFITSIVLLAFFGIFFSQNVMADEQIDIYNPEVPSVQPDTFYRAVVIDEPTEDMIVEYGRAILVQHIAVEIINGPEKGKKLELDFEIAEGSPGSVRLEKSDKIIVGKNVFDGEESYYLNDIYRLNSLWILLGIFIFLVLVLARWAGVRSLIGLLISFVVIIWFIVPRIIDGQNALMVGFVGTLVIATVSLFVAHGFRSRTVIAFVSTLITIFIALLMSMFFTNIMHIFGLGSEEALFLQSAEGKIFNLQGILLAGIIIGTLGVLDDITTAQAAVVEELHNANQTFNFRELFTRASSVGREHIISLTNTLILAYTGASLPLLLLFKLYEGPVWLVLNSEIIMEEIVRMLVGSIALVLAVPLTTGLAAWYYNKRRINK